MGRLEDLFCGMTVLVALTAVPANAAVEGSGLGFGGLIGTSTFSSSGTTTKSWAAGARWDFLPWRIWGLGLEWTIMPNLPTPGVPGRTYNLMTTAVDFDYRAEVGNFVFYGGPKLGAGIGEMADKKGGAFAAGVEVGVDYFFLPRISVGAVAEFVYLGAMNVNQTAIGSGNLLEGFGALKIWL